MREIKFRGRAITGIWVYGGIAVKSHGTFINNEELPYDDCCKVVPETIGQFTGLHDKNGKEIYEGDILKITEPLGTWIAKVEFNDGCFDLISKEHYRDYLKCYTCNNAVEVIGNIYENPELLKEEEKC